MVFPPPDDERYLSRTDLYDRYAAAPNAHKPAPWKAPP